MSTATAAAPATRTTRALLAVLALSAALPGAWATIAPHGFYAGFPGPLAGPWVAALPPFNEHLVRDVGAFYLAFALLLGWAAWRPHPALVAPVAAAWCAFSALHLGFHVAHASALRTGDAVAEIGSLALVLAAGAAVLRRSGSAA